MKEDSEAMGELNLMVQGVLKRMEVIDSRLRMIELSKLKEVDNYYTYANAFVELASKVGLSDEDLAARFVGGLTNPNHKLISILNPRTLEQAISYGRALTLDVDPNAIDVEATSVVEEVEKLNGVLEGKKPLQLSIAKEGTGESDDLQLQGHCKHYQMQNHKHPIYQPPHRRFSRVETEERRIAINFVDRKDDLGGLQGLSRGVTWLERNKDNAEERIGTELEYELSNSNDESLGSNVNRLSYNYLVTRKEADDFGRRNGITGVNSDKNVTEQVKKLNGAGKTTDSALDLAFASHKGFSEEMVVLSAHTSGEAKI